MTQNPVSRLNVADSFGHWFAGFFDGEGHLYISTSGGRYRLAITIDLRDDDAHVIERIAQELKCGTIHKKPRANQSGNPQINFKVVVIADLMEIIVPLFERYPLSSKKAREFALWKEMVRMRYLSSGCHCQCKYKQTFKTFFEENMKAIREIRRYK